MKRIILLGTIWNWSNDQLNLWLSCIGGVLLSANGVIQMYSLGYPIGFFTGIITIPFGIGFAILGFLRYHKSSRFAPRFSIDSEQIEFRENLVKSSSVIPWNEISKIEMGRLRLDISTRDSEMSWSYITNDKTSKTIKSTIHQIAEAKQIEVVGG